MDDPPSDDPPDCEGADRGCRPLEASETDCGVNIGVNMLSELVLLLDREGSYGEPSTSSSDSWLVEETEGNPVDGSKEKIRPRVNSSSSAGIPMIDLSKSGDTALSGPRVLEPSGIGGPGFTGVCCFEKGMA